MARQPAEPQRRRRWLWIAAGAVLAVAVSVTAATVLRDDEFTFTGTFALTDLSGITAGSSGYEYVNGVDCQGDGGYDDIRPGAQVTIYDETGTVLAVGDIGLGYMNGVNVAGTLFESVPSCVFNILVERVPAGQGLYQVEVSHRGKIAFTEEEGRAGDVTLTLG